MTELIAICAAPKGLDHAPSSDTWANLHNSADCDNVNPTNTQAYISSDSASNRWDHLERVGFIFDTSGLPDACWITSATLSLYTAALLDDFGAGSYDICAFSPTNPASWVAGDFNKFGAVSFGTVLHSALALNTWTAIPLNAAALDLISKTGNTLFGLMVHADLINTAPLWANEKDVYWRISKTASYQPKLTIQYDTVRTPSAGTRGLKYCVPSHHPRSLGMEYAVFSGDPDHSWSVYWNGIELRYFTGRDDVHPAWDIPVDKTKLYEGGNKVHTKPAKCIVVDCNGTTNNKAALDAFIALANVATFAPLICRGILYPNCMISSIKEPRLRHGVWEFSFQFRQAS